MKEVILSFCRLLLFPLKIVVLGDILLNIRMSVSVD